MLSKKIFLSAALVSMAGFVACGDDSSSNSGDGKLPEKVPTLEKALKLPCDETLKCEKVPRSLTLRGSLSLLTIRFLKLN